MALPVGMDDDNEYKRALLAQLQGLQQQPAAPSPGIDNQMIANFAQSMNKLGALGGRVADSSDVSRYADVLDKQRAAQDMASENRLAKQQGLLAELAKVREQSKEKLALKQADEAKTKEQRTYNEKQDAKKFAQQKELEGIKATNAEKLATTKAQNKPARPATDFEKKVAFQAARAADSADLLTQMETQGYDAGGYGKAAREAGFGKFSFRNEDDRKYDQAARSMIASILRPETGAAVTDEEMELYGPMYLPMPGDTPAVMEQKRQARDRDSGNLQMIAGSAYDPKMRKPFAYKKSVPEGTALADTPKGPPPKAPEDMTDEELDAELAKLGGK